MKINSAALTGFMLCLVALIFGVTSNGGIGAVLGLLHLPSAIITLGGAFFAALLTANSFSDYKDCLFSFTEAFHITSTTPEELTEQILSLSQLARKEGLLALENETGRIDDPFFKKGITLIVDGSDQELTRDILESEMEHFINRNRGYVKFWENLASYGPAWGMIGTLLGLINMMATMGDDVSSVGSSMSLALLTTLYGSILANWICIPLAKKLDKNGEARELLMELCVEGVLSIQAGENVNIVEEKLRSIAKMEERTASDA